MRNRCEINLISDIVVNSLKFVKLKENVKKFTVLIDTNANYVTKNIHSGDDVKNQTKKFKEFWTYVSADKWLLKEINQDQKENAF